MFLTDQHKKQIALWYCIIFYALALYKFYNGLFLFQLKPHLYSTRFDFVTWIFMKSEIHLWLLNNPVGWGLFDVAFYTAPILFLMAYLQNKTAGIVAAVLMLLINWIYLQCFTLYPTNSMESFTAWLLFPILFMAVNLRTFYFILHGLRYFFLYFFISAGIWKVTQGAVFHQDQMSGILLFQHAEFLATSPVYWYSHFIYWLVHRPMVGYGLYLLGTLLELSFIIGFFTRKYDRLLIAGFILFLVFDVLLMRIHYWEVSAFLIAVYYSKYNVEPLPIRKPINLSSD